MQAGVARGWKCAPRSETLAKGTGRIPGSCVGESDFAPLGLSSIRLGPGTLDPRGVRVADADRGLAEPASLVLQGQGCWAAQGSWLGGSDCQPQASRAGLSIHRPAAPTPETGAHEAGHTCRCLRRKPRCSWGQTAAW